MVNLVGYLNFEGGRDDEGREETMQRRIWLSREETWQQRIAELKRRGEERRTRLGVGLVRARGGERITNSFGGWDRPERRGEATLVSFGGWLCPKRRGEERRSSGDGRSRGEEINRLVCVLEMKEERETEGEKVIKSRTRGKEEREGIFKESAGI